MSQNASRAPLSAQPSRPRRASRAEGYRQRAADLGTRIALLPADQQRGLLQQQQALLLLAEMEEWVAVKPNFPSKHDYKLTPRAPRPPPPTQQAPRGRQAKKR